MKLLHKLILAFSVCVVLIVSLSFSAFALSEPLDRYDFTLSSYPMHTLTNDSGQQSCSWFVQTSDFNVYYVEYFITSGSNRFGSSAFLSPYVCVADNSGDFYFLPVYLQTFLNGSQATFYYSMFVYDTSGQLVANLDNVWQNGNGNYDYIIFDSPLSKGAANYLLLQTPTSFYCNIVPSTSSSFPDFSSNNLPYFCGGYNDLWTPEYHKMIENLVKYRNSPKYIQESINHYNRHKNKANY